MKQSSIDVEATGVWLAVSIVVLWGLILPVVGCAGCVAVIVSVLK